MKYEARQEFARSVRFDNLKQDALGYLFHNILPRFKHPIVLVIAKVINNLSVALMKTEIFFCCYEGLRILW